MRIIDKYIIKSFLSSFFYCLTLFIFLYIIIDLFGHLDEILKNGIPIVLLQEYYISTLPLIIMHTTPIAALISTIYTITTMNKYDEIIAMRAAGISIVRILMPFICMGIAISIMSFAISEKLLPIGIKNAQIIKENYIEKRAESQRKKEVTNIVLYGKKDRLIFIKNFNPYDNIAKNITILVQDKNGNVVEKLSARDAEWTGSKWIFSDLLIYKLDNNGMIAGNPLFFEEKDIDIENPSELIAKGINYEFMSFKDLANYIPNFSNAYPEITQRLRVDLHQKISFPFTNLIVILIGSGFAIRMKRRGKATALMGIGMSLVIGFLYYAFMATCIALGKGGILPPIISAHLANIVFGLIGLMLIK